MYIYMKSRRARNKRFTKRRGRTAKNNGFCKVCGKTFTKGGRFMGGG